MTGCKIWGKIADALLPGFFSVLIIALSLGISVVACAEEITYTGGENQLQETPYWFYDTRSKNALFPGTETASLSSGNKVTINYNQPASGAANIDIVFGGLGDSENASNNSVFLLNGRIANGIFGGVSNNGNAVGNRVSLNRGEAGKDVCGGMSLSGSPDAEVLDNAVTVNGDSIAATVVGGAGVGIEQGRIARNLVTINDGTVYVDVYGGQGDGHSVISNMVKIKGGSVGGVVCGGFSNSAETARNTVIISDGLIKGDVSGGVCNSGVAANNTATISGGSVYSSVYGGYSHGEVLGNRVIISGGLIKGDIFGGFSELGGSAKNNIVEVSGGSAHGFVCGGGTFHGEEEATYNTVTVSGRPDLAGAYIFGGYTEHINGNAFTGNTLNFKSSGISAAVVGYFQYYNFYLPKGLAADVIILSVEKVVSLAGTTVAISLQGSTSLSEGDKIALIHSAADISTAPRNKSCQAKQGGALYEFSIYTDKNNLWAEVTKISNAAK